MTQSENESVFTRRICRELIKCGCLIFVAAGNKYGTRGWPDRYVCVNGMSWWLEFKSADGKLQPLQKIVMYNIIKRGIRSYVIREPGVIENIDGEFKASFDGKGASLLRTLRYIDAEGQNLKSEPDLNT